MLSSPSAPRYTPAAPAPTPRVASRGPLREAWRTVTSPLRALTGVTGGIGGQIGKLFDPEGYEEASQELVADELGGEAPRDLGVLESAGAIPGLGDVIATNISKDGIAGRLLRPVTQIAGNIIGDPTSYVGVGLIPKLTQAGRATSALTRAQRTLSTAETAGDAAKAAEIASEIPTLAGRLARATETETALGRAARQLEAAGGAGATGEALRAMVRTPSFATAGRAASRVPFGPLPAIAYAPEIAEGITGGVSQTYEDLRAGKFAEAAASGVGTLMTSALAALVAKGLTTEAEAAGVLERSLARQLGETTPDATVPPIAPPQAAGKAAAVETVVPPPARGVEPEVVTPPAAVEVPPAAATPTVTGEGVGGVPPATVAPAPQPAPASAPAPAPVLESKVAQDKAQILNNILDNATATGNRVTLQQIADAGIITPQQLNTIDKVGRKALERVLGTEVASRLDSSARGKGYRVLPREQAPQAPTAPPGEPAAVAPGPQHPPTPDEIQAAFGVPVPGAKTPAAPSTPRVPRPRTEIDAELQEGTATRTETDADVQHLLEFAGKPLAEVGPAEIRQLLPGEENLDRRRRLFRAVTAQQKKMRVAAEAEAAAESQGAQEPVPAAVAAPPITADTSQAPAPSAPVAPLASAQVSPERVEPTTPDAPTPSARVHFPPREGPQGLDLVIPKRTDPYRTSGVDAGIEDSGVTRQQVERQASRATAPFTPPTRDADNRDFSEYPRDVEPTVTPLTDDQRSTIAARLTDGQQSPLSQVMRQRPRVRGGERAASNSDINNAVVRMMEIASGQLHVRGKLVSVERYSPAQQRIRQLLTEDIADDAAATKELTKLLATEVKNQGGAAVQKDKRGRTVPIYDDSGELAIDRAEAVEELAHSGMADAEIARTSITISSGVAKIDRVAADPDYPDRPINIDDDTYFSRITPPEIARYRAATKWALQEMQEAGPTRTGRAAVATPWMDVLRPIAQQLGIKVDPRRGADRLIKQIGKKLEWIENGRPELAPTPLLTDAWVAQRGVDWRKRIDAAPRAGDTDARVVDLEGDAGSLVAPLARDAGPLADSLTRATADLGAATGLASRFGGFAPSPQLNGVRIGDDVFLNPVEAYTRAKSQGLSGDALGYRTAEDLTNTLLHEIAHAKARHDAATGDSSFIEAYARAVEDAGPLYSSTIRSVQDAITPLIPRLESMSPSYAAAQEVVRGRISGDGSGTGSRRIAPIPPRRSGGARGAAGDGGAGVRPSGDIPSRGAAGGAGGEGAAAGEGAAPRDAGGETGGSGQPARPGTEAGTGGEGTAAPSAALTSLVPESLRRQQAVSALRQVQTEFTRHLSGLAGQAKDAANATLREVAAAQKLPAAEREKLRRAGPGKDYDIGLNISKYVDAMSDEQREAIAYALHLRNHTQPRSRPVTFDQIDSEGRDIFNTHTPEQWVDFVKRTGLRDARDLAALRTVVGTFGQEWDRARARLRAAEIRGDKAEIETAAQAVGFAALRRDGAIAALIPEKTKVARMLGFMRSMVHPLSAEENFRSRFYGAMRASKIPKEKAESLYQMFIDTAAAGGAGNWEQFARAFREATKPKTFDKFIEFWKAGLLGWPTQIANLGSNLAFFTLRNAENGVAALADSFLSGVTGAPRKRYVGEVGARMMGLRHAMSEIMPILRDDLTNIATLSPPDIGARMQRGSFADDPNTRQLYGAIEGKRGEFVRIPFKLLDASDNVFKHISRMQEYAAQAHRLAQDVKQRSPGESSQHATARIFDELRKVASDPVSNNHLWKKSGYKDAIEAGRKAMLADTFQTGLGDTMRKLHHATQAHPALQLLFPFVKTPYNILAEGMKRTPAGAIWAAKKYAKGEIDRPEFVTNMVKSALGSLVMAVVADAALDGTITGSGPTDPKQQELLKRTGWQPYSIKVGDQYLSYSRGAPFSTIMGLAADLTEAWKRKDMDTASEITEKLVGTASDNILDQSFVAGLDSLLKILTGHGGDRAAALRQLQASLVPNVIGVVPVAHAARALDPVYRETEALTMSPFLAQIPGASTTLPAQYGPSGEQRLRKGTAVERLLSPVQRSEAQHDAVAAAAEEIVRLGKSIEKPPLYIKVGDEKLYYTQDEREAIGKAQERALEEVAKIISQPGYHALPDQDSPNAPRARTKGDIILSVKDKIVGPVKRRIDRDVMLRGKEQEQ